MKSASKKDFFYKIGWEAIFFMIGGVFFFKNLWSYRGKPPSKMTFRDPWAQNCFHCLPLWPPTQPLWHINALPNLYFLLHALFSFFMIISIYGHTLSDLKFVKKFTRPNFRANEFYTLKMRKSRLFSPAINSKNSSLSVIWPSFG